MSEPPSPGIPPDHPSRAPYRDARTADAYARERFTRGTGPSTDRRERVLLEGLLSATGLGPDALVLDCPAGAGRMEDLLAARGFRVVVADQSPAMLGHAVAALGIAGRGAGSAVADATLLPFRDGTFDLVLCHRLIHHFATMEERGALLRSLRAASRRWVLLSWFDAISLQHLRRVVRRPFRASRRHAITAATLQREASQAGLRLHATSAMRPLVSEITFSLFEVAPRNYRHASEATG
jgi:SAM-dependent methyltransferase